MGKTTTIDAALRDKLANYLQQSGMSQTKFGGEINYSSGAISAYLSGKYTTPHMLEPKIREYFRNIEDAATVRVTAPVNHINLDDDTVYLPTSISERIYGTIRSCHLKGGLAVEVGDAGIGKTRAAMKYIRDYSSAVYIVANPCIASVISMMKELCIALGLPVGRKDDMWRAVRQKLSGEPKVLIIDESQHLPIKTLDNLRTLSDANRNLGIVFIGNFLTINSAGTVKEAACQQIKNRIGRPHERHTTDITLGDIEQLFPALVGKEEEVNFLLLVARSRAQGIRGTVNLYNNAVDNDNITYEGLVAMAKYMRMSV